MRQAESVAGPALSPVIGVLVEVRATSLLMVGPMTRRSRALQSGCCGRTAAVQFPGVLMVTDVTVAADTWTAGVQLGRACGDTTGS
jgi:hypothetical protein